MPAVAVTLNTNDFGDVRTLASLAQVKPAKLVMDATATSDNANLVVVSGTQLVETSTFLHGASLSDFAIVCGNLPGVTLWAPVQDECSLGTLADNIDQTLFMDDVFINSLEFSYTTGANATENYGAETDQKMWLLNAGRFVNFETFTLASGDVSNGYVTMDAYADDVTIATLANGNDAFLRKDANGEPAVTWYDTSANQMNNVAVEIISIDTPNATEFRYNDANGRLHFPTGTAIVAGDRLDVVYAGSAYSTTANQKYFAILDSADRPDIIGAIRQGQIEIFIVDPSETYVNGWSDAAAWRLTGCTMTCDLTREPLTELGHLGPYDRPLTLPIPITVTVDTTAGDLENWSKIAGKLAEYTADTLTSINLADLIGKEDLLLVAKVYAQTDEEAGGTSTNRTLATNSPLIGQSYLNNGVKGTYAAAGETEYALKTVVVEHLKITDEAYTLDLGTNATQTFGFRSTNDLYAIKGDIAITNITGDFKIRRNG